MHADPSSTFLAEIVAALDLPSASMERVSITGEGCLPSCLRVSDLAVASIGAAALAISDLVALNGGVPRVVVDRRLASLWFGWSIRPEGWRMPEPWDALAGDYQTRDGWIRLHTNAPHHRASALSVLRCDARRPAVTQAVRIWNGDALEDAIVAAGGAAAVLHTSESWSSHPQGVAVTREPLVRWDRTQGDRKAVWRPKRDRPLAGLRVLDLTRVLAGPVATRFLAGYGANVLRIDPPEWDEPGVIPEVTLGKRCARLDLRVAQDRAVFERLVSQADILVHGYRAGALEALGYGAAARETICPGLIDVSLDAYGHSGPWSARRGFDSLVQFSTGISAAGMSWRSGNAPVSLPVQALDHATGYLMAAAAVRGVIARVQGDTRRRARLSLARTAKLLIDHKGPATDEAFPAASEADIAPGVEQTSWGPCHRLKPPVIVGGADLCWSRAAAPLGTHGPSWDD